MNKPTNMTAECRAYGCHRAPTWHAPKGTPYCNDHGPREFREAALDDREFWLVKRRPWQKPASLCTRARNRREAARQYREKLHREGERQPRILFVTRWKVARNAR